MIHPWGEHYNIDSVENLRLVQAEVGQLIEKKKKQTNKPINKSKMAIKYSS